MGADLYLLPVFDKQFREWRPKLENAVKARDATPAESAERQLSQEVAKHCFEQMYSQGYFRDSYNPSNLLWKFGLSWWRDVVPLLDKDSQLLPFQARHLLFVLKSREGRFEDELRKLSPDEREGFRSRYEELKAFLGEAIRLNCPIEASL